jgi:hypothetical protein
VEGGRYREVGQRIQCLRLLLLIRQSSQNGTSGPLCPCTHQRAHLRQADLVPTSPIGFGTAGSIAIDIAALQG